MPPILPKLSSFLRQPPPTAVPRSSSADTQHEHSEPFASIVRPLQQQQQQQLLGQQTQRHTPSLYDTSTATYSADAQMHTARPRKRKSSNSNASEAFPVAQRQPSPPLPSSSSSSPLSAAVAATGILSNSQSSSSSNHTHKSRRRTSVSHSHSVLSPDAAGGDSSAGINIATTAAATTTSAPPPPQLRERTSRYLSEGDRRDIIRRIESGEKQVTLAKEYSVSRAAICNLYKNRREVLTRVDRDPDAKHPKKQRPKKFESSSSPSPPSPPPPPPPLPPMHSPSSRFEVVESSSAATASPVSSPVRQEPSDVDEHALLTDGSHRATDGYARPCSSLVATTENDDNGDSSVSAEHEQLHHSLIRARLTTDDCSAPLPPSLPLTQPHHRALAHQPLQRVTPFVVHDASAHSLPIRKLLGSLRSAATRASTFRHQADRMMRLLVEEALSCVPQRETDAVTPYGDAVLGVAPIDAREICAVSMEEQGGPVLLRAFADVQPLSPTGVLTLTPTSMTAQQQQQGGAWQVHAQLPPLHHGQVLLLFDLACATGERACSALSSLVRDARVAPASIYYVTVNSALPGLQRVHHYFPDVALVTAQLDSVVDDQSRIRPGIGDFLERYWNPHYQSPPLQFHKRNREAQYSSHAQMQARMQIPPQRPGL